jgi:hypothetical protein
MTLLETKDNKASLKQDSQEPLTEVADFQIVAQPEVAEIAYFKAESRGFIPGYELNDWLEAEQELNLA